MTRRDDFRRDVGAEPQVLDQLLTAYEGTDGPLRAIPVIGHPDAPIVFAGMGSSHNASMAASWWLQRRGVPSWTSYSSKFAPTAPPPASTLVAVSKSGSSVETLAAVEHFRAAGGDRVIVVTNEENSVLAERGDLVLPILAGREGPISAKSYAATVAVLLLLTGAWLDEPELRPSTLRPAVRAGLDLIDRFDHVGDEIAAELSATPVLHVLGSGAGVAGAREGAVIFKEGPGVPAEALTAAEWLHGAYRAVRPGRFTALLLLGSPAGSRDGEVRAKVESLGGAVVEIGPLVVGDPALGLPGVPRSALPLVEGLALELCSLAVWKSRPEATS